MEIRFRDGPREVPEYIGELVAGLDVRTMTYDEAIAAGNRRQADDIFKREITKVQQEHLRRFGT